MKIKELFQSDVTRDIPPVVYFHEQSPTKLAEEVSEYIVTGGHPEGHPKHTTRGLHEHYVKLLKRITAELSKAGGPELPAAWISGCYGSGKSSFAKLLGLSLDGAALPDGSPLADAWLRRDTSARRQQLVDAWRQLHDKIDPLAIVFDIGGISRGGEHIHSAVVRRLATRLGYCDKEALVADYELKLECDGLYSDFVAKCQEVHGRPWDDIKGTHMVEDEFSVVLHHLFPDRYLDPMDWVNARSGRSLNALSAEDAAKSIQDMLKFRAPGKTLFIVVDEVSQYIFQDDRRMLALQSLVSALGQRLKGQVWLVCTGQQKLDDQNNSNVLGKMKDRFPAPLRVHLDTTNIRDVVHKRLLHKHPERAPQLRAMFQEHRNNLRLFAFGCEDISEEDFAEIYPMLPKHIDLIMQITSALRTRSTRSQGDDHAIRGLLQLLGELFREQGVADMEMGQLISLDLIYEVQASALDADVQNTMARIMEFCRDQQTNTAARCAKVVSLLELLQHDEGGLRTDANLVAKCLYNDLREGSNEDEVEQALELLRTQNLLGYSANKGYKIQSSAGQDWERERANFSVPSDEIYTLVQETLERLVGDTDRPQLQSRGFPWKPLFSNDHGIEDQPLRSTREEGPVTIDFRYIPMSGGESHVWVNRSAETQLKHRIVWVDGQYTAILDMARTYGKARRMVRRYTAKRESLPAEKRRLLLEEEAREEGLKAELRQTVAQGFMSGRIYFQGADNNPQDYGASFITALVGVATKRLPDIYQHFVATTVTSGELAQLTSKGPLSGPSQKFFASDLGILDDDAGRIVPSCSGAIPKRVHKLIEGQQGVSGATLLKHFSEPPYGHTSSVVKACIAGLLRAGKIRVQPSGQPEITTIGDGGVRDFFEKDRTFKQADIFPSGEQRIKPQDRAKIQELFATVFDRAIEPENEPIADAVGEVMPATATKLRNVEKALNKLPGCPDAPAIVHKLSKAIEDALRSRQVEPRVLAVRKHLATLRDGVSLLNRYQAELTQDAIESVRNARAVIDGHYQQLVDQAVAGDALQAAQQAIALQLRSEHPWRDIGGVEHHVELIRKTYEDTRTALIAQQGVLAEAARERVKGICGYARLGDDDRAAVLRILDEVAIDTTPQALAPPLTQIVNGLAARLDEAREHARYKLDEIQAKKTGKVVVQVTIKAHDIEIATVADVESLLDEIRQRLMEQISKGQKVRLSLD
ncbi:MAG: BREX system P-loop protein BrxC [Nannocystaceae bacterium]